MNGRVTLTHWVRNPNVHNSEEAVRTAREELQNRAGGFQTVVTSRSARDRRARPLVCRAGADLQVSDRPMSERYRDLVQRRVSRAWPPRPSIQSATYLVKYEWPDIAIFYAMARLANDVGLAPGRLVTPDFAAHARRLLAALGQLHKIYDGEACALSKEPAAKDGLRAHDRP